MTDRERLQTPEALKTMWEYYELACRDCGYTGTIADFRALILQVYESLPEAVDMDEMDIAAAG